MVKVSSLLSEQRMILHVQNSMFVTEIKRKLDEN